MTSQLVVGAKQQILLIIFSFTARLRVRLICCQPIVSGGRNRRTRSLANFSHALARIQTWAVASSQWQCPRPFMSGPLSTVIPQTSEALLLSEGKLLVTWLLPLLLSEYWLSAVSSVPPAVWDAHTSARLGLTIPILGDKASLVLSCLSMLVSSVRLL